MTDPLKEAVEIREQIASEKRKIGFFCGAGTSMAVKLPGIEELLILAVELYNPPTQQYDLPFLENI